jgi:hypothetical protein
MSYVEYSSNNSGGLWWLTDQNWLDLEKAGWEVRWYRDDEYTRADEDGRWLGALAGYAKKPDASLREAIREWESVTGQDSSTLGCSCCGTPHSFTLYDDNGNTKDSYSPDFPFYGDPYDGN